MKQVTCSNNVVDFLHSIFDSVPMRSLADIEMNLRCHPVTKEAKVAFDKKHEALFEQYAVLAPKGAAGKGGGKVKETEMVKQIPAENKEEYHNKFLELSNEQTTLVLAEEDVATLLTVWLTPEWLIDHVERFATAKGIDSITHQKVLMNCRYALEDGKEATVEKADLGQDGESETSQAV